MKGAVALAAAALLLAVGDVDAADVARVWERTWPILLFLLAGSLVAELCDAAGLFDRAAHLVARAGRGSRLRLFLLVCLLAVAVTVVLSLDTTAVLLTPVLLTLAASIRVDARPFAYVCVWLANAGSLLLPVSNLTNLLAAQRLGVSAAGFVALTWAPAAACAVTVVAYAALRFHVPLRGRYDPPTAPRRTDTALLAASVVAVAGFAVAVLAGAHAWAAAGGAALVLLLAFAARAPARIAPGRLARMLPFDLAAFAFGLFVVVGSLVDHLTPLLGSAAPGTWGPWALAGASALAANAVDNLPAYLAFEGFVGPDPTRLTAVLVGVGAGPLILPWASLANLLWWQRCRARGLEVRARDLAREGAPVAILAVAAGTAALVLVA